MHALNGNVGINSRIRKDQAWHVNTMTWNCQGKVDFVNLEDLVEKHELNTLFLQEVGVWNIPPQCCLSGWKWIKNGLMAIGIASELAYMHIDTEEFEKRKVLRIKLEINMNNNLYL